MTPIITLSIICGLLALLCGWLFFKLKRLDHQVERNFNKLAERVDEELQSFADAYNTSMRTLKKLILAAEEDYNEQTNNH